MTLLDLRKVDAGSVLRDAARVMQQFGLAKGMRVNPNDGSVDLLAALAIALGAKKNDLHESTEVVDIPVPDVNRVKLLLIYDYLDSIVEDPDIWADDDGVTLEDVVRLFRDAATRVEISIP